ncbi:dead deah box DNA helicase [Niveomyces insectorum RCEF 264]|uniref:Dead deah box DNA helicase n=1 Tax=Niveomyces insectorum RCEF 264 TaxID=1081102 RepID=A0A167M9B0_9HYPO|nr:dead deah box DNA helicase [Niveomyces insectorum RCEF 264]
MRDMANHERSKWESYDPEASLDRSSLADHTKCTKKYRQTAELSLRKGYITVVVAIGTMALGINMPYKTVIFSGNSTFLNASNYRQASGRAGRRGFDILGNVVFYVLRPQRVFELMSSCLPDLRGHFPRHHLLSANGSPINFTELVSHLYFTKSAAFAFHALLLDGYFHKLCANVRKDEAGVLQTLVLALAHIFKRYPCRRYNDAKWLRSHVLPSSSVLLLPRLPPEAEAILRTHNESTLSIFQAYVQAYIRQHAADQPDNVPPFTGHKVGVPAGSRALLDRDMWFLSRDFSPILAAIVTSLETFMDPDAAPDDVLAVADGNKKGTSSNDTGGEGVVRKSDGAIVCVEQQPSL